MSGGKSLFSLGLLPCSEPHGGQPEAGFHGLDLVMEPSVGGFPMNSALFKGMANHSNFLESQQPA